jgi:MFS family permease
MSTRVIAPWLTTAILYAAHALLFRFAELVAHLGGSALDAGRIVGVGVVCSLASRWWLGSAIDRRGVRMPWLASAAALVIGAAWIAAASELSWLLYAGRIAWTLGFTSGLACAVATIQQCGPDADRAERLGMLETAVFTGLILGTIAGHAIFALGAARYAVMCGAVVVLAIAYVAVTCVFVTGATPCPQARRPERRRIATHVLVAALLIGTNFAVTTIFLTRYFTHLGWPAGMAIFFLVYCGCSFPLRFAIRRWLGNVAMHHLLCVGLAAFGVGQLALITAEPATALVLSAVVCAIGRALAYPTVVALGAGAYPADERGHGSAVILAVIDVGLVIAAAGLGAAIDHIGFRATFTASALACLAGAALQLVKRPEGMPHAPSLSLLRS